jgi:hypothetical protein
MVPHPTHWQGRAGRAYRGDVLHSHAGVRRKAAAAESKQIPAGFREPRSSAVGNWTRKLSMTDPLFPSIIPPGFWVARRLVCSLNWA